MDQTLKPDSATSDHLCVKELNASSCRTGPETSSPGRCRLVAYILGLKSAARLCNERSSSSCLGHRPILSFPPAAFPSPTGGFPHESSSSSLLPTCEGAQITKQGLRSTATCGLGKQVKPFASPSMALRDIRSDLQCIYHVCTRLRKEATGLLPSSLQSQQDPSCPAQQPAWACSKHCWHWLTTPRVNFPARGQMSKHPLCGQEVTREAAAPVPPDLLMPPTMQHSTTGSYPEASFPSHSARHSGIVAAGAQHAQDWKGDWQK